MTRQAPASSLKRAYSASPCEHRKDDDDNADSATSRNNSTKLPCERCANAHRKSMPSQARTARAAPADLGLLEALQARVAQLESLVHHAPPSKPKKPRALAGSLAVKEGRFKHQARTQPVSILSQFEHVKPFLASLSSNPQYHDSLDQLRRGFSKLAVPPFALDGRYEPSTVSLALDGSLPCRGECDRAASAYFARAEPLLALFDQASFWQRYQVYWDNRHASSRRQDAVVPCLALMCALMAHFGELENGPALQQTVALVKAWLSHLSVKKASDIESLQAHALFVVCFHLSGAPSEALWKASGELVRSAMIAGLHLEHRQPFGKPTHASSPQQRLWFVILELDVQGSLLCGLPPALTVDLLGSDWPTPDSSLPYTRAALLDTLECRLYGSALLHEVETGIDDICDKLKGLNAKACSCENTSDLESAMLMVVWHRSIMSFSRPLLDSPRVSVARVLSTASSLRVLRCASALEGVDWSAFATACGRDIFQAALVVCCMIQVLHKGLFGKHTKASSRDECPWNADELFQYVRAIPDAFLARADNAVLGTYLKDLVALSVVVGSLSAPSESVQAAMQSSFGEMMGHLSLRTDTMEQSKGMRSGRSDVASTNGPSPPEAMSDMDPASLLNTRFDFYFGPQFEDAFPLDPDVFRFDPTRE